MKIIGIEMRIRVGNVNKVIELGTLNNAPENLQLMSNPAHSRLHGELHPNILSPRNPRLRGR